MNIGHCKVLAKKHSVQPGGPGSLPGGGVGTWAESQRSSKCPGNKRCPWQSMYRDCVSMNVTQPDDPPLTGNFTGGLHRTSNQILTLLDVWVLPHSPGLLSNLSSYTHLFLLISALHAEAWPMELKLVTTGPGSMLSPFRIQKHFQTES